ncbi:MAG TPA: hypothetical protein VIW07_14980 [Candidatus Udaeobacter sp.]|jgi:hypothetical protein
MGAGITSRHGETAQHARLKQHAFIWAQTHGFSACALEVTLPRCRYRADVAGYRPVPKQIGSTAVFECKQGLCDLRRDNCRSEAARERLEAICNRRHVLEAHLRTHYPNLHNGDSLFPEFDSENFTMIGHRGYARVVRELRTLQNRLYDCTKFEKLIRYRCANLFFIVLPERLFRDSEVPVGWGALIESNDTLVLIRKPMWHEATSANRLHVLHRIAVAGTRNLNRKLLLDRHE